MNTVEARRNKNMPLTMPENRESLIHRAAEEPEGCISAGWQAPHPLLGRGTPYEPSRPFTAKFAASAALLEEIAKKANAVSVLKRSVQGLLANARSEEIGFSLTTDPETKTILASYLISTDAVMSGVEGIPEDILEWLKAGLSEYETVSLTSAETGKRYFKITQLRQDEEMIRAIYAVLDNWGTKDRHGI